MNILRLKDVKTIPDIIHLYPEKVKFEQTPLIIDNGNFNVFFFFC